MEHVYANREHLAGVVRGMSPPKAPKVRKWEYVYVLQGNYGHGYEDLTRHDTRKCAQQERDTYIANSPEGSYRIVHRREINPDWIAHKVQGALAGTGWAMDVGLDLVECRCAITCALTGRSPHTFSSEVKSSPDNVRKVYTMVHNVLVGPCSACCTDNAEDCLRIEQEIAKVLTPAMVK